MPLDCLKFVDVVSSITALGCLIAGFAKRHTLGTPQRHAKRIRAMIWIVTLSNLAVILWLFSRLFIDLAIKPFDEARQAYAFAWCATFLAHLAFAAAFAFVAGTFSWILKFHEEKNRKETPLQSASIPKE